MQIFSLALRHFFTMALVLAGCCLVSCEADSKSPAFRRTFGFTPLSSWKQTGGVHKSGMPPEIHYHFQVSDADFRAWDPKGNGYAVWQPMTNEQRFQSGSHVIDGNNRQEVSSQALFTIRLGSSPCLVVYDPVDGTLTVLKAHNAMGVKYP